MINKKYEKVVERHKPTEKRTTHALVAFLIGGLVGVLGEVLIQVFCQHIVQVFSLQVTESQ